MLSRTLQGLVVVVLLTTVVQPAAHGGIKDHEGHHHGAHDTRAPGAAQKSVDCQSEEGLPVVTVEGLTTTLPQPVTPFGGEERTDFVLDLGEVPAGTTATVTAIMSWTIEANDWDLRMEDAAGTALDHSLDFQPYKPPVEQVSGIERPHCGLFTLVSINPQAGVPTPEAVDSLDTVISVTNVGGPPPLISLDDCHMTLHLFKDSAERLSAWIPDRSRYTPTGTAAGRPDQAWLTFWFYSCRDVSIYGGPPRTTNLSLVGVVVRTPEDRRQTPWEDALGSVPVDFDHYLVWAHTDNGKLAKHLGGAGMPVERVNSIDFQRPNDFDAFTSVVSSDGSYSSSMSGHKDDFPHYHDNSFWYDDPLLGESQLRIQIGSPQQLIADDWSCKGYTFDPLETDASPSCSSVSAEPGSGIEGFLGGSTRDESAAFNHLEFDATASLISHR